MIYQFSKLVKPRDEIFTRYVDNDINSNTETYTPQNFIEIMMYTTF